MKEDKIRFRVKYAEVDRQDAVYHAYYFIWFDMGRTEFLRKIGVSYKELEDQGFLLVVTKAKIKYLSPARLDDEILLKTRFVRKTRIRLVFEYEVFRERDNKLLTIGETELACISREGKAVRIPEVVAKNLG